MLVAVMATLVMPATASAQKVIFLVRHAERADAGGPTQPDPALSAIGQDRAKKLAAMLADAGVTAISVTNTTRTQQTAQPLATKLGLHPEIVDAPDTAATLKALKTTHKDDVVLVVGHSNTVPAILKAYGKDGVTIADSEFDNLFVIVPKAGTVTRLRY
jgi:broad specificity phosphatase PhoE